MKKALIAILFLLYFIPATSFAAEVFFGTDKNTFAVGEEFLVQVFLNTENMTINAAEGNVIFPQDLLSLEEIRDGNSSINFWVERPHVDSDGKIYFSGITPGGFFGSKKFLFGAVFKVKKAGNSSLYFDDTRILQNDGLGTRMEVKANPLTFSASEGLGNFQGGNLKIEDIDSPEDFVPLVTKDPGLFDGRYFVVFSAIDKGVGIDHYEIREGIWSDYAVAESPYLLKDQSLGVDIVIKAVDKAGNSREVKVRAQNPNFNFEISLIFVIILSICFLVLKKIWSKSSHR